MTSFFPKLWSHNKKHVSWGNWVSLKWYVFHIHPFVTTLDYHLMLLSGLEKK